MFGFFVSFCFVFDFVVESQEGEKKLKWKITKMKHSMNISIVQAEEIPKVLFVCLLLQSSRAKWWWLGEHTRTTTTSTIYINYKIRIHDKKRSRICTLALAAAAECVHASVCVCAVVVVMVVWFGGVRVHLLTVLSKTQYFFYIFRICFLLFALGIFFLVWVAHTHLCSFSTSLVLFDSYGKKIVCNHRCSNGTK